MNGINPMSLAGRTVLITGASQGIGLGVARLAADLGANLVLADMNAEELEAGCGHFAEDRILAAPGDVADPEFVETLVEQGAARFGPCHIHQTVDNRGSQAPHQPVPRTDRKLT
jgi:3-oxoacyl-[acyl-carrier protein] reductase